MPKASVKNKPIDAAVCAELVGNEFDVNQLGKDLDTVLHADVGWVRAEEKKLGEANKAKREERAKN